MQWILILTIVGAWHADPAEVRTVPGFASKDQCLVAAKAWTAQMAKTVQWNDKNFRALCVQVGSNG